MSSRESLHDDGFNCCSGSGLRKPRGGGGAAREGYTMSAIWVGLGAEKE